MKSLFQFFFSLFFVSFLLGQETAFNPLHKISGSGVDTAWVRQYGSGLARTVNGSKDIKVDTLGNVYITGFSDGDYLTIKYNSVGNTEWMRRYNGPGNGSDIPTSLSIDVSGNVYVTGSSYSSVQPYHSDYATIKYNSNGDIIWVRRYNGPGNGFDVATSLAVDGNGNVFVTGSSVGLGTSGDYATIKYSSNGETVWVGRYNGSENDSDYANTIAVDGSGNVYVTGSSGGDYVTIKYNSAGDIFWLRKFIRDLEEDPNRRFVAGLAVDGNGNVYVIGSSARKGTVIKDYTTIKYTSAGDSVWVRRFNGSLSYNVDPISIAVDGSGNAYVSGTSWSGISFSNDFTTIKYNSTGDTVWVRRYDGPIENENESQDYASSLAVDGSGNLFVTGFSGNHFTTIKYNSNGDSLWMIQSDRLRDSDDHITSLVVDGNGNIVMTGIVGSLNVYHMGGRVEVIGGDFNTIKVNGNGFILWEKKYRKPASDDYASSFDVDRKGNVYVTGSSAGSDYSVDYSTIKYQSNGNLDWASRYNGPERGYDASNSLAVDSGGNVHVTGVSADFFYGRREYATIKYDAVGDMVWVKRHWSQGVATALAIDGIGHVYVTGYVDGFGTGYDYVTIKYNPNGDTLWLRRYNGPGNGADYATSLTVDRNGNVYVTGTSRTIKYSPDGNLLWNGMFGGVDLDLDTSGNVYITGDVTVKYNPAGDTVWVRRYPDGTATSLEVDGNENVNVTGTSNNDFATIKYNSVGDTVWVRRYTNGKANSLAVEATGNVYVTGTSDNNIVTIKYNNAGDEEWVSSYSYGAGSNNIPVGIKVDPSGNVYVGGTSSFGNTSVYTVIKYIQSLTGDVREISHIIPSSFALEQNYPNPFNPTTTIRYSLPSSANVKLSVYDLLGREIATLVNEEQSAGWKEVQWNASNFASGIYLVKMNAVNFNETKKILLMK